MMSRVLPMGVSNQFEDMSGDRSKPSGMRRQPRQARSLERVNRILDVAAELFEREGYSATTTNAIAAQAQVPIGSLYQFFPDKAAIMQALASRYTELLHQQLAQLDASEMAQLDLPVFVDRLVGTTAQFFMQFSGYHAIFMQVQGTMPELDQIDEAVDAQLIQDLVVVLSYRDPHRSPEDYEAIAFVVVKVIGTLLWLSLSQEEDFRERLILETKKVILNYLQEYFGAD